MMFERILVPTDFGPASERALRFGRDLASRLGASLIVLRVIEPPPPLYPSPRPRYPFPLPARPDERAETANAQLEAWVRAVFSAEATGPGPTITTALREGYAAPEIVSAAEDLGADLVLIGSRGRSGLPRFFLGSVAEKVVRLSTVPVIAVHPWAFEDRAEAGRALAAALGGLARVKPRVVATSRGAVPIAAEIAARIDGSSCLLLTSPLSIEGRVVGAVAEDGTTAVDPADLARVIAETLRDQLVTVTREKLDAEGKSLRGSGWSCDAWGRTAILVMDALVEPWSATVATDVLRRVAPASIVLATPVASPAARAAVERVVDQVITLDLVADAADTASIYHHDHIPRDPELAFALHSSPTS